jgi:phosphohistidine phosphatase
MQLFVIRHAIAVERGGDLPDEARPLTQVGIDKMRAIVRGLRKLEIELDTLRHSPWTRAVETADLLMPLVKGESVVDAGLARPPTEEFIARLSGDRCGVVGHEPWMSDLVSLLTQGHDGKPSFQMRKGGVAWLEGRPRIGEMHLVALLPPRVLRKVR